MNQPNGPIPPNAGNTRTPGFDPLVVGCSLRDAALESVRSAEHAYRLVGQVAVAGFDELPEGVQAQMQKVIEAASVLWFESGKMLSLCAPWKFQPNAPPIHPDRHPGAPAPQASPDNTANPDPDRTGDPNPVRFKPRPDLSAEALFEPE